VTADPDPHPHLTLFFAIWAAVGPMVGIGLGYLLTSRQQRKQWFQDRRREEYRELLSALTTSYMTLLHISEQVENEQKIQAEISLLGEKAKIEAYRVLRDRIIIAEEIMSAETLVEWDTAVTNYLKTLDTVKFANRFSSINATLVHMARKTPRKPPPLVRYRFWRARRKMWKEAKEFSETL
jgi:hypothetical protein